VLLEYGANIRAVNEYGQTPFDMVPQDVTVSNRLAFKKLQEVNNS
jgi:hypothetical protein